MSADVTCASDLDLTRFLAAQHPALGAHDGLLFIIVRRASELWLKLRLHDAAIRRLARRGFAIDAAVPERDPAVPNLERVLRQAFFPERRRVRTAI